MTRFRAVLVLQVCAIFTIWAQDYDRLQIRFDGKATLSVRGETPSCGFAGCPYGSHYCSSFWNLCEGERSRTVVIPGSYLTLGAEFGGMSYSSGATLDAVLNFSFLYNKPTLNIPGYSYTPKQELGFLYFVDNVYAATLALAAAACNGDCCPDPGRGSASASASSAVRTTIVGASSSSSRSASCSECPDSDGGGSMHSDPPYPESYRGKTAHRLSLNSGIPFVYTEKINADITLNGSASGCAAAGSVGYATASAGIITQVAPHPLGVPAIGENEYVWSDTIPATLSIPAAATGYAWGWEPDLNWIAEKTVFRVEPDLPTEDTKPGIRTVAIGDVLVAQSLDGQTGEFVYGLFYRSKYLPPKNEDFGKKKVFFEVEGAVDYAEVEVFFPADATNHPPSNHIKGYSIRTAEHHRPCIKDEEIPSERIPNWFYYYWDAYGCKVAEGNVYYGGTTTAILGLTCPYYSEENPCVLESVEIYLFSEVSPCPPFEVIIPLYSMEERALNTENCQDIVGVFITPVKEFLKLNGIYRYVVILEHELAHKRHLLQGFHCIDPRRLDSGFLDLDNDGLDDEWELVNGLHSCHRISVDHVYWMPDAEVIAYIEGYGRLLEAGDKIWEYDWATCGLQYGEPVSPFPWTYQCLPDSDCAGYRSNKPYHQNLLTKRFRR